ncbi:MAG TPA: hypothetical protein VF139_13615 [Candidatus Polarisedimenticolaceae bacterium]
MTPTMELPVLETTATGLCATCSHAPACTHHRIPGVPVAFCDDLSPLVLETPDPCGVEALTVPEAPRTTALKGLCATCERRVTCTYPKPESGVWRCEEFE